MHRLIFIRFPYFQYFNTFSRFSDTDFFIFWICIQWLFRMQGSLVMEFLDTWVISHQIYMAKTILLADFRMQTYFFKFLNKHAMVLSNKGDIGHGTQTGTGWYSLYENQIRCSADYDGACIQWSLVIITINYWNAVVIIDHWNTGFVYIDCADTLHVHLVFCTYFKKIFMGPVWIEADTSFIYIWSSLIHIFFPLFLPDYVSNLKPSV